MAGVARIPRSRGSLCGLLLVLLGAWGGLIPFVGPYFHYAFTPDKTWAYTSGRLYLEVVPGIVVVLGGLLVLATRSRTVGSLGAFAAALGGAWFVGGYGLLHVFARNSTISPGSPVGAGGVLARKVILEQLGFFAGLGAVIVFFAALALGRFSLLAARDADAGGQADYQHDLAGPGSFAGAHDDLPAGQLQPPATTGQFPAAQPVFPPSPEQAPSTGPFPSRPAYPPSQDPFPTTTGQYPPPQDQFPTTTGQYPPQDPFPSSSG
jgi:hypothetical protein